MPIKDLSGRRRRTPAETALQATLSAHIARLARQRRGPSDDDMTPASPPPGPSPLPLAGAADPESD